jgi:hypothetical protein
VNYEVQGKCNNQDRSYYFKSSSLTIRRLEVSDLIWAY